MNSSKVGATIVGVLYIIGTVAGVLGMSMATPVLKASDFLARIRADEGPVTIGALFVLVMGLALAMVPVVMFPILKKQNEALALGYVVFRGGLETFTYIASVISWLLLVPLSQTSAQAPAAGASDSQALGSLLIDAGWTAAAITAVVFSLGALMFYYLLYQSKLIPRWISVWGLITAIPYLASGVLFMFGLVEPFSATESVLQIPLGVQEMVMAVWLIGKGFNLSALASAAADRLYHAATA